MVLVKTASSLKLFFYSCAEDKKRVQILTALTLRGLDPFIRMRLSISSSPQVTFKEHKENFNGLIVKIEYSWCSVDLNNWNEMPVPTS
jgi:hypothetical protein